MKTAIIIPTFNNEDYTIRCMKSIADHTENYIIIWVDDGSSRESIGKVKSFLAAEALYCDTILKEENTGFATSVNLGLKAALEKNAEYIVIQNNDTQVFDGWLTGLIKAAESDEMIGAVGPITSPCMSWQSIENIKNEFDQFAKLPEYDENPGGYAKLISEKYKGKCFVTKRRLAFFSVLLKRDVVMKVGMLSEEYGVGFGEDDDYMIRLRQDGYLAAIAQDVFVFHDHNVTFKEKYTPEELQKMKVKNQDLLFRKFRKGKYRPENIDQIYDIEELSALAKTLKIKVEEKSTKNEQLARIITKYKEWIDKYKEWIENKNRQLADRDDWLADKNRQIAGKDKQISRYKARLEKETKSLKELQAEYSKTSRELDTLKKTLAEVYDSTSWKITAPLRKLGAFIKKGLHDGKPKG